MFCTENQDREHFLALILDANGHIIGIHNINTEPINEILLRPCEVFKAPILANAHAIIVGHSYPSGETTPSVDGIEITGELMKNYPDGISQKYHYQFKLSNF